MPDSQELSMPELSNVDCTCTLSPSEQNNAHSAMLVHSRLVDGALEKKTCLSVSRNDMASEQFLCMAMCEVDQTIEDLASERSISVDQLVSTTDVDALPLSEATRAHLQLLSRFTNVDVDDMTVFIDHTFSQPNLCVTVHPDFSAASGADFEQVDGISVCQSARCAKRAFRLSCDTSERNDNGSDVNEAVQS